MLLHIKESLQLSSERCRGRLVIVMVQKVAVKRKLEAGLRHATTGKLSLSTRQ